MRHLIAGPSPTARQMEGCSRVNHVTLNRCSTALAGRLAPFVLGITVLAGPALAQDAPAPQTAPTPQTESSVANAADQGDVIVVTGTRISRPDLVASSPVATISAEALKQTGTVTIESLLQQNSQFVPASGSSSNNPGTGAATLDLRGLDPKRTLVLIDGKRAQAYDTNGTVDINTIPPALIKRIDVLTGGASAVYGSDAIAGVVNFILDDRFEGVRADATSSVTERGDGAQYDASLTAGAKLGDRGNVVLTGGYSKRQGVKFGQRNRNSQALDSSDLSPTAGSSNANPTVFDNTFNLADGAPSAYQVGAGGVLVPGIYQLYNFTPVNYAQAPFERYNVLGLARYELTDGIEAFVRGSYTHNKVVLTLAPTATAGFPFNISPDNPFLSASERALFFGDPATLNADGTAPVGIRRRITETAGRVETYTSKSYQAVGGLRGTLANFNWEVFGQYGVTKRHVVLANDLSYTALSQALDAVPTAGGGVACRDPSNGCVPLNVFNNGVIPANQLAYVLRDAIQDDKTTELVTGGNIGGDIGFLKSPFADKPAAVSVGVEYRRETGRTSVDPLYASGDLIYYGQGQNIAGKYNTKEAYTEIKMPLVTDKPFFYALDLEGGFRYSDYSNVGSVYTYKGGGDWSPVEGVRFRGIYQRAVRAPNLNELFSPVVAGTGSLNTDPCAGAIAAGSTLANLCIATGAPAASIGRIPVPISGQINILTGGNANLDAEKSDTYTVGVVVNPPQIRALSFSVDYYNVRIGNAINTFGGSEANIVNTCYNVAMDAASPFCQAIHRNTATGSLSGLIQFGVSEQLANISVIKTNGVDVTAGYHGKVGPFTYAASLTGTYVRAYDVQADPTSDAYKCAGRFTSQCNLNPIPKWKHVADLTLGYGGVDFLTRWRFIGKVKDDTDAGLAVPKIKAFSYFDETVSFEINDKLGFRVGVQNAFDKKSPIVGDTVGIDYNAGSTFPNVYDVLGRTFFASVSATF